MQRSSESSYRQRKSRVKRTISKGSAKRPTMTVKRRKRENRRTKISFLGHKRVEEAFGGFVRRRESGLARNPASRPSYSPVQPIGAACDLSCHNIDSKVSNWRGFLLICAERTEAWQMFSESLSCKNQTCASSQIPHMLHAISHMLHALNFSRQRSPLLVFVSVVSVPNLTDCVQHPRLVSISEALLSPFRAEAQKRPGKRLERLPERTWCLKDPYVHVCE